MKHRFTLLFALLCASMMTWAAEWTGQVTGTATNVWLDGIGSNENRTEVNYTVNYLVEYNSKTLTITLGYTEDNFNKTVGLVPQVFVNGAHKGNFGGVTWSSTEFAPGAELNIYFYFAYNEGSSNSSHFSYTIPSDGGGEGTEPEPTEIWDVNFALQSQGATATAKSGNNPGEANDGNEGSRWWSATGTEMTEEEEHDQWWQVNLGQRRIFNTIQILWEGAWGKSFDIQISDDGAAWTTVKQIRDQNIAGPFPYLQTIELDEKKIAQYVRFQGVERGTGYAYSFWEFRVLLPNVSVLTTIDLKAGTNIAKVGGDGIALTAAAKDQNGVAMDGVEITYEVTPAGAGNVVEGKYIPAQYGWATIVAKSGEVVSKSIQVFGLTGENLALNKPATAGANETPVAEANDASLTSYWSLGPNKNEDEMWWRVDLEETYDLSLVIIKWEGACPTEHAIQVSTDNTNWTDAATLSGLPEIGTETDHKYQFYSMSNAARYIRVKASALRDKGWGMKIYDFQAFGTLAATLTKPVSARVNDAAMGTATVEQGGAPVTEVATGSEVTFSAVANDGYIFVEWSNGEKNATFTTTVDATLNLTATFRKLGTTYCNTEFTAEKEGITYNVYVTYKKTTNENEYALVVRSTKAMVNFSNAYVSHSPIGETNQTNMNGLGMLTDGGKTLSYTFTSLIEPGMNTPLYINFVNGEGSTEVTFLPQLTDIEFAVSCEDNVEVESIALDPSETTIEIGASKTLIPSFTPAYALNQTISSWDSSDETVATVANGVVTANAIGTTTITATSANGKTATCNVTVEALTEKTCWGVGNNFEYKETEVSYHYAFTRNADKTLTITAEFSHDITGIGNLNIVWNDIYHLMAYNATTKTATYTTVAGDTYETDAILPDAFFYFEGRRTDVTYIVGSVCDKPIVDVTGVEISNETKKLLTGETFTITANVIPANADNKNIIWSNSNPSVASIDEASGLVTALTTGTTIITATSQFDANLYATCEVTVVGALEPATWYGTAVFKVKGNPVAVNYSITRTSERKLTYRTVLSETVTGMSMQLNDGDWRTMTQDATGRIAEWTSTNTYLDDATHSMFFYPAFDGGSDRWDVNYTVGSSNEKPNTLVAFGDQADNTAKIAEYADEVVDAYINRTFPNTDEWYTLCLPFDMDEAQLAATFGAGYTLATLGNSEDRGSLIHLNFDYVNTLEAGKPYLLRPGVSTATVPMIEAVTIKNVDPSAAPQKAESAHMHFQGTFAPTTLEGDNKRFVGPNNYLYSPAEGGTNMKSFRCYFTIPVESQALVGSKAARIVLGPQVATGTENVQSDQVQSTKVIIDGTLYIIRDGRTYNAQGQLVK